MAPSSKTEEHNQSLPHSKSTSPEPADHELTKKRKSKSPAASLVASAQSSKRSRLNDASEDQQDETSEDIARQYKKFSAAPKFDLNSEEVFCICRKPDTGGKLMVCCDGCEEWFHFKCMKLDERYAKLIARFFCKFCRWKGIGRSQYKRKCRVDWCWEPVRADSKSKYCSDAHGLLYLKQNIVDRSRGHGSMKPEEIKSILAFIQGDYEKLIKLGTKFPELPEVIEFKNASHDKKDYSKFPPQIRDDLLQRNSLIEDINKQLELCQLKSRYLVKVKDRVKIINSKLVEAQQSEDGEAASAPASKASKRSRSRKSSRMKKIDLCCYDSLLSEDQWWKLPSYSALLDSEDIYEDYKSDIDGVIQHFEECKQDDTEPRIYQHMCIRDRRKCTKHNGWWNLMNDELFKYTTELSNTIESLEDEKSMILRDYSVKILEASRID